MPQLNAPIPQLQAIVHRKPPQPLSTLTVQFAVIVKVHCQIKQVHRQLQSLERGNVLVAAFEP